MLQCCKGCCDCLLEGYHLHVKAAVTGMTESSSCLQIVEPFGETVAQVFARVSALRDSLDGPQLDDQGLIQDDSRFIAVPDGFINLFPTDIQGISFSRVPQMVSPCTFECSCTLDVKMCPIKLQKKNQDSWSCVCHS